MCDGQVETTLATASNFLQSGGPKLLSSENSYLKSLKILIFLLHVHAMISKQAMSTFTN